MAPTTSSSLHRQLAHPYSRDSLRRSTRTRRAAPSLYPAADETGTTSTTATTAAPAWGTRTKRSRSDKDDSTSNVEISDKVPPRRSKRAKTSSLAVNKRKAEDNPGFTVSGDEEETTSARPKTNKRARLSLVQTDSPHPAPARGAPAPDADEDDFSNFCRDETDDLMREHASPAGSKLSGGSTSNAEAEVSTRRAWKLSSKVQATPGSSSSTTRSVKRKHEDEQESKTLDEDKHPSPSQAKRARSQATPILDLTAEETEEEVDVSDDRSEEDGDRAAASPAPEVAAAPTHYFMTISASGSVNLDTDDQAAAARFDALRRDGRIHHGNALEFAQSYRDNMHRAPTAFQPAPATPLAAGALADIWPDAAAVDRFAGLSGFGSFGAFDAFHSSHGAAGFGAGLPDGL
ncbi:hypothetical protein Rhopal_003665-T1 [Rhodotorula paludigena]|uniref:Proteophosphoglycan ppg4 n=1 Tax=Rhodotorula paludigena TaxID=86838 RepID=A0AAV5GPQ7_9BASI|nr:hypothetical protein Rhopal_003665-T1 [Rhodotorula paludigena]